MSVSTGNEESLHTSGTLDEYFQLKEHLLSTRSADAFTGHDVSSQQAVTIWKLRHPLPINSPAVRRFLDRLAALTSVQPPLVDIQAYGVDSAGVAFAVMPALDGQSLVKGRREVLEAERQFIACVRLVEKLHQSGVVCGDLCGSSFWLSRDSDVSFIGIMGSFDTEAAATAMLPPLETLNYVAPEQRGGGGLEAASDVFALGVLGYYLLMGRFPFSTQATLGGAMDSGSVKPLDPQCPLWAKDVLWRCFEPRPEGRYQSANEILEAIAHHKQRGPEQAATPSSGAEELTARRLSTGESDVRALSSVYAPIKPVKVEQPKVEEEQKSSVKKFAAVMCTVFCIVIAIGLMLSDKGGKVEVTKLQSDLKFHIPAVQSEPLKQAIAEIGEPTMALEHKAESLDRIMKSDDPISHAVLMKAALEAPTVQERELAERAILDRGKRQGLERSTEQVRQWLRAHAAEDRPPGYIEVLKALDISLPVEERNSALRTAYSSNPRIILRLAGALAMDTGNMAAYEPILVDLLADTLPRSELEGRSATALILGSSELSLVYGDDMMKSAPQMDNEDVQWTLKRLVERSDPRMKDIAAIAIDRELIPPLRRVFIDPIENSQEVPPDVISVLVKAVAGGLVLEDLRPLSRWYDTRVEDLLLAICADHYPEPVLVDAFDMLAGRSVTREPVASLITWIRERQWEQRASFVHAVGVLGLPQAHSDDEVKAAVGAASLAFKSRIFMKAISNKTDPRILREMVKTHGYALSLDTLLDLLNSTDKDVRIYVLHSLTRFNDVGMLKLILDRYGREKDPDVRKVYEEKFWVVRQRAQQPSF